MPYVPIKGFAPDAEPTEQGVLTDVDGMVPTLNGLESLNSEVTVTAATLPSACTSLFLATKLDETTRFFSSSNTVVREETGGTWTTQLDIDTGSTSMSATSAYERVSYAQYRDNTYIAHKGMHLHKSTGGGFTSVDGAPKASVVATVSDFAFLFDVDDTSMTGQAVQNTYGNDPARWRCSAFGNLDSWTANVSTQATTGELNDTPGPIVAAHALGNNMIAFKKQSMYVGRYVGPPKAWRFDRVNGDGLGTWGKFSVVSIETALLFPGYDNFYMFDGVRPVPIGTNRVAQYFLQDVNYNLAHSVVGYHDKDNWRVFWWYPSGVDTRLNSYLCYNYRSDRWGAGTKEVGFVSDYREGAASITYDTLGGLFGNGTYDGLPLGTYDLAFLSDSGKGKPAFAVVDPSLTPVLTTLTGAPGSGEYVTGDLGGDNVISALKRVRPRFRTVPSSATQTHYIKNIEAATLGDQVTQTELSTQGTFDQVYSARWHRLKHEYQGAVEVVGLDIQLEEDGLE